MAKRWCMFLILVSILMLPGIISAGCVNKASQPIDGVNGDDNKPAEESVNRAGNGQAAKTAAAYNGTAPLPPDMHRIISRGKLITAMYYQDRAPWFYVDKQGQLSGIDVDMARDIARVLGVDVEFDRAARSFNEVVDRVAAGKADMAISKLSVTLARAQRIRYTQPYIVFNQALLVNRLQLAALQNSNPGKTPLELILKTTDTIAVAKGTSYEEFAHDIFVNAKIASVPQENLFAATARGDALAALYDENEINMFMKKNPELSINAKVIVLNDRIDPIAIAVAPQDQQLLSWLNQYLEFMKSSVSIKQQVDDYIGGLK